jgi:hypothetical protein
VDYLGQLPLKARVGGAFRSLMPHAKNAVTRFLRLSLTFIITLVLNVGTQQ